MAGGDEVPAAAQVGPGQVRGEPAAAAVAGADLRVLAVDVVDPVGELEDEVDRVEVLPDEVRRVPVEPERRPVPDRLQRAPGGPVVVRDLAGVHLVREPHADLVEDVEDRVPPVGEVLVAALDHRRRHRREHGHGVPDRRAGEADDGLHAELGRGPRGVLHLARRPAGVPPRARRRPRSRAGRMSWCRSSIGWSQTAWPTRWLEIAKTLQVVLGQRLALAVDVVVLGERPVDLEVVAPAGDLQAVVAPLGGQPADLLERQVGPLAGEERDGSRHVISLFACTKGSGGRRGMAGRWHGVAGASRPAGFAPPGPARPSRRCRTDSRAGGPDAKAQRQVAQASAGGDRPSSSRLPVSPVRALGQAAPWRSPAAARPRSARGSRCRAGRRPSGAAAPMPDLRGGGQRRGRAVCSGTW